MQFRKNIEKKKKKKKKTRKKTYRRARDADIASRVYIVVDPLLLLLSPSLLVVVSPWKWEQTRFDVLRGGSRVLTCCGGVCCVLTCCRGGIGSVPVIV